MKHRSATPKSNKKSQMESSSQKKEYFDEAEENMQMLEVNEHHDEQYQTLLKSNSHANLKKNSYFFTHQRYQGTTDPAQVPQPSEEEEENDMEPPENQIVSALKELRKERKRKSELLTEDIRQVEEEDEKYEKVRKQQKTSAESAQQGQCLKSQLHLFKDLVELRYSKQSELDSVKRLPCHNFSHDERLNEKQKEVSSYILGNLSKMLDTYKTYAEKVLQPIENGSFQAAEDVNQLRSELVQQGSKNYSLRVDELHRRFSQAQQELYKKAQHELVKWSQKTSLINLNTSRYSSLLMQTPVGQAKKAVEGWDRVKHKSQQKRGTFRVLFQDPEEIRESSHPQIFDDFELFHELQKTYVNDVEEDNDFRLSDTLRYLRNRQEKTQKAKQVDRKASKNRKLRYQVHSKLLNFMPSRQGSQMEARDSIVSSLFNCQVGDERAPREEQTYYIDV